IFRSPYPDVSIPEVALTPFVMQRANDLGDKPAFVDAPTGRTFSFGELAEAIERMAAGLAARGFRKGDVFAIFAPNMPQWAVAFHGVATAGGINTTINSLYTADEIAYQLKDSGARFLLTVPGFMDRAADAAERTGIEEIFVIGGEARGATPFAELLQSDGEAPNVDIVPRQDLVVLPYSSGTTGLSKGVMLTHHNLVANLCQFAGSHHVSEEDRIVAVLPFFHI